MFHSLPPFPITFLKIWALLPTCEFLFTCVILGLENQGWYRMNLKKEFKPVNSALQTDYIDLYTIQYNTNVHLKASVHIACLRGSVQLSIDSICLQQHNAAAHKKVMSTNTCCKNTQMCLYNRTHSVHPSSVRHVEQPCTLHIAQSCWTVMYKLSEQPMYI